MKMFIAIALLLTFSRLASAWCIRATDLRVPYALSEVSSSIKLRASTLIAMVALKIATVGTAETPRVFTFAIFFVATMSPPVLACTGKVLPTPANYTGLCGCTAPNLPILQAPGIPCPSFAYGCMAPGENVTDGPNCTNPNAMKAGTWLLGDRVLAGSGWMDATYLSCLDCPTLTTTAAVVATSTTSAVAAATTSAATTTAAATTLRASTTNAATTTSQALTTSTASAITSTYAQATSLGAEAIATATTSVSTTAPASLSPTPVQIDGFISVSGPWTATAITIFSDVNTSTSGLARLTVDGPVTISRGASATIEISEDIIEPKRLRLILATSISGDFDSVTIQPKKSGCTHIKYHVKSVSMATMLAVDVSSETERSCPTHRAWLIGVIVFGSVFGVAVIIAFIGVSMERWKPEWSYLSRRRVGSASYFDANAY